MDKPPHPQPPTVHQATLHAISWFEIAVHDFARARTFYNHVLDCSMAVMHRGDSTLGLLPHDPGKGIGGAIVKGPGRVPSRDGVRAYLSAGTDLSLVLARVEAAGGEVLQGKTPVAPRMGHYALLLDSEGNQIGLHSPR